MKRKRKHRKSRVAEEVGQKNTALVPLAPTPLPQPSVREQRAIGEASQLVAARRPRAQVAVEQRGSNTVQIVPPHADISGWYHQLQHALGTTSPAFVNAQLQTITRTLGAEDGKPALDRVNAVLALADGLAPENELEAALAVQIGLTHQASCDMLARMT